MTLTWSIPTENTDGTTLTDLAGYNISYGTDPNSLTQQLNVSGGTTTTYAVGGLTAGTTYYFAISAYDSNNDQSAQTSVVSAIPVS